MSLSKHPLLFKRNVLVNMLKFTGVGAACFVFEACYGVPPAEDKLPAPSTNTDITGVVRTAEGIPVPGAEVLFTSGRYGDTLKTYTNAQGVYLLDDVSGRLKTVYLEAHGAEGERGSQTAAVHPGTKGTGKVQVDITVNAE